MLTEEMLMSDTPNAFFEVTLMHEGGGSLKLNAAHIVAVKKREKGGFRVWLSAPMEIGDEPDRLLVLAGMADDLKTASVLNVASTDLEALFPTDRPVV